jgi:hypothetical protein
MPAGAAPSLPRGVPARSKRPAGGLGSARLGSAWLGSARLGSAVVSSAVVWSAQLSQLNLTQQTEQSAAAPVLTGTVPATAGASASRSWLRQHALLPGLWHAVPTQRRVYTARLVLVLVLE